MNSTNYSGSNKPDEAHLDRRYGKIGIPAVAAAVAYQSEPKNTAYAPVELREDDRYAEMPAA